VVVSVRIPNRIVCAPAVLFVAVIASRREMRPSPPGLAMSADTEAVLPPSVSAVVVTTRSPTARKALPNSEVLSGATVRVAVVVTYSPIARGTSGVRVTPKVAVPDAFVVTLVKPR
jgi:hypothetical protein